MSSLRIEFPHELTPEDARARIRALGDYLETRHGIGVTWDGDRASVRGRYLVVAIDGVVSFAPGLVIFDGKDPGFLWRKKARDYLTGKLKKYLDPGVSLADLPRA